MPTRSQRDVSALLAVVVASLLIMLGVFLWLISADTTAVVAAKFTPRIEDDAVRPGFYWLHPTTVGAAVAPAQIPRKTAAADYTLSKTVMLQSVFDANDEDCAPSAPALTVGQGEAVVYCYIFTNIGSTRFITVSLTDDKLGGFGPIPFDHPLEPAGKNGFVAYGVIITETTTNTAVAILTDENGASVTRSDSATVHVGVPATLTPTAPPTVTPPTLQTPTATPTRLLDHKLWLPMMLGSRTVTQN